MNRDHFIGACAGIGLTLGAMALALPGPKQPVETLDPALTHLEQLALDHEHALRVLEQLVQEQRLVLHRLGEQRDWLEYAAAQVRPDCSGYVEAARDALIELED